MPTTDAPGFASTSLPAHLVRGAVGFGALIGTIALYPILGLLSAALLPLGLLALRGCPTCWLIGLAQTVSRGRVRRDCQDGQCSLTVAHSERPIGQPVWRSWSR
ncbi:hypothetical protein [Nocardia sp. AG03]|uniref:hypothetical protein n=1 Tax=Nocardia sp. AG03 TaxID=3025312 RepID=UPI0024183928|nr:hypothetical protein [Nocardia sp. AG03]